MMLYILCCMYIKLSISAICSDLSCAYSIPKYIDYVLLILSFSNMFQQAVVSFPIFLPLILTIIDLASTPSYQLKSIHLFIFYDSSRPVTYPNLYHFLFILVFGMPPLFMRCYCMPRLFSFFEVLQFISLSHSVSFWFVDADLFNLFKILR